jgi:hypothetical protein
VREGTIRLRTSYFMQIRKATRELRSQRLAVHHRGFYEPRDVLKPLHLDF